MHVKNNFALESVSFSLLGTSYMDPAIFTDGDFVLAVDARMMGEANTRRVPVWRLYGIDEFSRATALAGPAACISPFITKQPREWASVAIFLSAACIRQP